MNITTKQSTLALIAIMYASVTSAAYPILELREKNGILLCAFTMTSGTHYSSNPPERATCPRTYIPIEYLVIVNPREGITFTLGNNDFITERCDTQGTPQYALADLRDGEETPPFPTNAGIGMDPNIEIVPGIKNMRKATKMAYPGGPLCVIISNPNN
ncbi:hypothetical protein [Pseudomonas sp. LB1P83]